MKLGDKCYIKKDKRGGIASGRLIILKKQYADYYISEKLEEMLSEMRTKDLYVVLGKVTVTFYEKDSLYELSACFMIYENDCAYKDPDFSLKIVRRLSAFSVTMSMLDGEDILDLECESIIRDLDKGIKSVKNKIRNYQK